MALEKDFRPVVTKVLRPIHGFAVENLVKPGTPDVAFIGGWMELKVVNEWPKNVIHTKVRVRKFTPLQRRFLQKQIHKGGHAFLFVKCPDNEYFLFKGDWAAAYVDVSSQDEWREHALKIYKGKFDLEKNLVNDLKRFCSGDYSELE